MTTFTDGSYTEVVQGWTIQVWESTPHDVSVTGPRGQDFTVDRAGDVCVDVFPGERGRGWDGDTASARYVPVVVLEAAIRVWRGSRPEVQVTPPRA